MIAHIKKVFLIPYTRVSSDLFPHLTNQPLVRKEEVEATKDVADIVRNLNCLKGLQSRLMTW